MIIKQTQSSEGAQTKDIYSNGVYLSNNITWHAEDSPWKARQISRLLIKNNIFPNSVCEIGCGAGAILTELSTMMPVTNFVGYELSPQAFELCKARVSEQIQYYCSDLIYKMYFTIVYCALMYLSMLKITWGLLNHLRQRQPIRYFISH